MARGHRRSRITIRRGTYSLPWTSITLPTGGEIKYEYSTFFDSYGNGWDFSNSCPLTNCPGAAYMRMLSQATTLPVPGGSITKQTQFSYDSPQTGNITAIKEWTFYAGASPSFAAIPDRATYLTYLSTGINNIDRPVSTTVCNNSGADTDCPGGGNKVAQTKITYDSYGTGGLTSVTGVANHDDTSFGSGNTARGNPTQVQRWVSGASYLTTQLFYDTTGQVTQAIDPAGNLTSYGFADKFFTDTGANPPQSYTPTKPTNAYLTSVTPPLIGTVNFGYYYSSGKRAFSADQNGATTYFHYVDSMDRPTQTSFPIGWNLTNYTSATQVDTYLGISDASPSAGCSSCRHNQVIFDSWDRRTSQKLVNSPGGTISVDTNYDSNGRVQNVSHPYINPSDPTHVFETPTYDGLDRIIKVTRPDNQYSQTGYGPLVTGAGGISSQQGSPGTYGLGYPVISVDEAGKQRQVWIDGFGRVIEVDEPTFAASATSGTGGVTISGFERSTWKCIDPTCCNLRSCAVQIYDAGTVSITVNRLTKTVGYGQGSNAAGIATALASAFNADPASPVTASVSVTTVNLTAKQSGVNTNYPLSSSWTYDSDDFDSPSFTATPSGATLAGGADAGGSLASPTVALYTYDVLNNLTQVVQGAQTRSYSYDGLGRRTSMITPEAGTTNLKYTKADGTTLCSGDPGGVCRRQDARGVWTTYTYDALSRLTQVSYNVGTTGVPATPTVTLTYDEGGATGNALGRLTTMTDGVGSEKYQYDGLGRVTQVQKTVGTTTYTTGYQLNVAGELTQITYPSGHVVQQSYDAIGRLCEVAPQSTGCGSSTSPYANSYSYNAAGHVTGFNYGNGVAASFSYSPNRLQLTNLSYTKGTQTLFSLSYLYQQDSTNCPSGTTGNNGQVQCMTDTLDSGRTVSYTYDVLGRLSTAVSNGSAGFPKWGLSWNYDRYGNRLAQTVTAGSGPSNSLSFANPGGAQRNQPDGYPFDLGGNMLNDGYNTLAYDAEDRLISSTNQTWGTSTYTYDGKGIRVKKVSGGTTTVYIFSGGKDIAEYDNGAGVASPSREYIYSGPQLLATVTGNGPSATTTYHHADHLSVRVSTDGTTGSPTFGQKIGEQGHFPYGEAWYTTSTTTKFIFTTYERDSESGLDYAMARFYISRFGRFCSADPVEGEPDDPQSWNRYAYVRNDPVNLTDPDGQFWGFLGRLFRRLFRLFKNLLFKSHKIHLGGVTVRTPPFFAVGASFGFTQLLPGGGKVGGTPPFFPSGTADLPPEN